MTIPPHVLSELQKPGWPSDLKRILAYARKRRQTYPPHMPLPGPQDIVQTAIEKFMNGDRTWNPGRVNFVSVMFGAVKSLYHSEAKKIKIRFEELEEEKNTVHYIYEDHKYYEDAQMMQRSCDYLRENYPDLAKFYKQASSLLETRCTTDKEVAQAMGLRPPEFNRKREKISTIIREWMNQQNTDDAVRKRTHK